MLTDLCGKVFTVINKIPKSSFSGQKISWEKHIVKNCACVGGIYDKSKGTISNSGGKFTVYIKEIGKFKAPSFSAGGYYALEKDKRTNFFTLAKGDLIVFDDISGNAPESIEEYDALIEKYGETAMTVSGYEMFCADGWKTSHIEVW